MRGVSSAIHRSVLLAGEVAPDFELPALVAGVKKRFHLREQLQKTDVVLAFYPLNWNAISGRQLAEYQAERSRIFPQAEVVAISVDSIMNTTVWEREIGPFEFPLCSDFWPHGEVTRSYGVFREQPPLAGASERATFVIGKAGQVVFSRVYGLEDSPPISDILQNLRRL